MFDGACIFSVSDFSFQVKASSGEKSPLGGSVFTVSRVSGVVLRTQEGGDAARGMALAQARDRGLEPGVTAATDAEGRAQFTGLPIGLYYVTETPPDTPGQDQVTPVLVEKTLGASGQPVQSSAPTRKLPSLATTASSVLGVVALGAVLIGAGVCLVRRNRRRV